jgi:uncharacterized protein
MKAGILTLRFRLFGIESIKDKRSIVKHLLADIDRRGPSFAACEADDQDDLHTMTIRVAHVSNDARFSDAAMQKLRVALERGDGYELDTAEMEML